jgi:hypothetical protein
MEEKKYPIPLDTNFDEILENSQKIKKKKLLKKYIFSLDKVLLDDFRKIHPEVPLSLAVSCSFRPYGSAAFVERYKIYSDLGCIIDALEELKYENSIDLLLVKHKNNKIYLKRRNMYL